MQHVFSAFLSGVRILDSSRVYVFEYLMAVKLVIHGDVAEKQSSSIQEHAHRGREGFVIIFASAKDIVQTQFKSTSGYSFHEASLQFYFSCATVCFRIDFAS